MNRRIRSLAALLALFALSAYFGESVWASVCPPGMDTHAVLGDGTPDEGTHAGMNHGPVQSTGDSESPRSDAPVCPFGMTGAGSSCVAASLPAPTTTLADPVPGFAVPRFFLDGTHDRLLTAQHFRPPRA
ncbi:MAG: hypothetical protein H0U67_06780 [Gemmatimonadetes bacterium]|nr:hypothetical protein [Gemmatimonadota bacterium]